jgi:hypothetical protein
MCRTLIYIIDERTLYRDIVYNVPQERYALVTLQYTHCFIDTLFAKHRRDQLLRKLRGIIFESLQEFNDTMPSYSYIADYFDTDQFNLLNCLSQYARFKLIISMYII